MAGLLLKSGLLSIMFVLVGSLVGYAAPLTDRDGMAPSQTTNSVSRACMDMGMSAYAAKMVFRREPCQATLSTTTQSKLGVQLYHPDGVWGDKFSQAQLMVNEFFPCLSRTKSGTSNLQNSCNVMGMLWINSFASIGIISETFHSLYEFVLPEGALQKDSVGREKLAHPGRQFGPYRGTVLSNRSSNEHVFNILSIMELLGYQDQGLRNLAFWETQYQVEVFDTITRFIPKVSINTRKVELEDVIALCLLLFLLPDYKKLHSLFGTVWKHNRLGHPLCQ